MTVNYNHQQAGAHLPAILTKQEAANYVRCTPRYIENMVRVGRLRVMKPTGKLVRIRLRDLDAFLESGSTIGGDK